MRHAAARRRHARRRAQERYGLEVGTPTLREIGVAIRAGQSTPLGNGRHDVTLADGYTVRVVYRRGRVVTFLPRPGPLAAAGRESGPRSPG